MKKALFILMVVLVPVLLLAQPMDTVTIYFENFDGATNSFTTTGGLAGTQGDWRVVGQGISYTDWETNNYHNYEIYKSAPKSFRTPVYSTSGNSNATTGPIPLTTAGFGVNHVYVDFDHICKVHSLDVANIYYCVAQGVDADGNYNWGPWKLLNFTSNNSGYLYYFGQALGTTGITSGKFNHEVYSNWASNNMNTAPTNTWWHHELLDISRFIFVESGISNPTHFRLQFRVNKASPTTSGTQACAGWFLDNFKARLSNCELIPPRILMQTPVYYNTNNSFVNQLGPFTIKAKLTDNDTVNLNSVVFSYEINSGQTVIVPNTNAFTNNIYTTANSYSGHDTIHAIDAQWVLPAVCYQDTIYYHIYMEDTHGSSARFDTFLVAHHNYTNIHQNDVRLDSLSTMPHCLITGQAQPISVFFTNRSDALHSPLTNGMTSGSFTIEVRNEAGTVTETHSHNWTGDICFDIPSSQTLGTFVPSHGYNYVTVYVTTRNGQADGFHTNDTLRISPYACDSLMQGHYTIGGTNPDFATLDAAKASLEYCGLGGPVTFHLRPGTYSGFTFDQDYIGQSAVNTVTFQGDNPNSVILVNNSADAGANIFGAVTLVNVNNFIFKNLTIQAKDTTVSRGVVIRGNGSRNIRFDGCIINARNTHTTDFNSCAVVRSTAVTAIPDTVTFHNCRINSGNVGIYYVGANNKRNYVVVDNCDITACYRGVCFSYTNGVVSNNHIKQVSSSNPQNFSAVHVSNPTGIDINGNTVDSVSKFEYAVYVTAATLQDYFIRNNHIKATNCTAAIYVNASSSTHTTGNSPVNMDGYITNNEVIFYPVMANNSYGIQINNSNNLYLVNNSVLVKSDAPYSNTAALYISNGNNNTYIYNNLLINKTVCSDNTDYPLYLNGNATATGTFNDFYSGSGVVAYKTVARSSIAELENAVTTLTDNISYLPPIANETQSLLPTSMSGLECWRHASVMSDIRGINRSELTYIGAYADAVPNYDAELTSIVSPALGECPQSSYAITVKITNKGGLPLNFASTPATIKLISTSLNINQTATVNTGTISPLSSMNQVITSGVVIPSNQPVDFTIIINYPGDGQHANDTLHQNFTLEYIVPDYSEDFSNGTAQTWTIEQISGAGNWTFQNGEGANPTIMPVYGTGRLFFNSKTFAANTTSRAVLPVTVLDNATNPILEVWFAQDNTSSNKKDEMTVKISTDNGVTYTSLTPQGQTTAPLQRYLQSATVPEWNRFVYDLSNYISSGCVYIAFDAVSKAGNNINVDRIRVRSLYPNDIAVSKIYGAGETPMAYGMRDVVSALVRNEGSATQTNVKVYLNVVGAAEQWHDSITIASLAPNAETLITFPDHHYNVAELKDVEVRCANDQNNTNNSQHWRMVTTQAVANIADTTTNIQLIGDYNTIIRPCVRYKTTEDLAVRAVKYYYDQTYIADPENGFRAFVANANGTILATSQVVNFNTLQQGAWNEIPIYNFALTNTTGEFYVGLEMLSHGNYLCAQVETPLRDSTFYYLNNGVYEPQLTGRFMIGAVVDTPFVHDVALLELLNPVSGCDLGHENLTVKITNNGTTDIVPPIQLHYTVNNGPVVTENFTDTLHSHEITQFAFNSIYDFTNNLTTQDVNYTVRVWATKLTQDRVPLNDTLALVIVSERKAMQPIVQDTVIVNYHTSTTLTAQLPTSIQQGVLGWFTNTGYESWNLLGYNSTYTTPLIYFDTTYYVTANPGTISDVIVGTGTGSGVDPFTFANGYSRGRILYLEQEIGAHGTITSFAFNVKTASSANASQGIPMRIYLKCTDENVFTNTTVNWDDEILGATLVLEDRVFFDQTGWFYFDLTNPFEYSNGNLEVFVETNCADYCTGTGTQCNNCGQYVSGAASYPQFYMTNTTSVQCQKKGANTTAQLVGAYTNVSKRPNARFTVADLECGSEKVPVHVHVPNIPSYDVETQELIYPATSCALYNEHIQVQLKNMLNTPIPANKVVVHAVFNGTEITHLVDEAFDPEEVKTVVFTTPFDFSAPTTTITFNYTIYTTLNNETVVYGGNDTITGSFQSTRTAYLPDSIVYTCGYTLPYVILQPADRPADITQYYFYDAVDATTPIHTTTTAVPYMTTAPLYDTVVYWVEGKTQQSNCITKRIPVIINVFHPQYDLSTEELLYPVSYQCASSLNPQLQVSVMNQDTATNTAIPAGTFNLNAKFTGAATVNGVNLINTPISSLHVDTITYTNGINLGSITQNRIYNYVIYSTPAQASMPVYTANDTITGTMYFPALPVAPQDLSYTVAYGGTQTVTPSTTTLNHFYFYENPTDNQVIAEGASFTTEPIFAPTTYYYSGRIESPDFKASVIAGTGNVTNQASAAPFTFTNGHSYAKILYNKEDMGGPAGRIDSIYFHVCTAEGNGIAIPMKFWLKDTTNVQAIGTAAKSINWSAETANATLVFDGELALDATGWVGFAVQGGYDFNGEGLLLYAEHDCGDASCVTTYGINPTPKFTNTQMANNGKKVYTKAQNAALTAASSFTLSGYRVNTKFKMNYTCESPKATITINTTVPQNDVGVVAITAPVTPNNSYTATENVTVTIQNFGSTAASNFPISYQLDNNTPVSQTYTASLAPGATANVTFTTPCDLTGVYYTTPFRAYTEHASDTYHANDTTTIYLSKGDPCESRPLVLNTGAHITNVTFASLNNGTAAPYTEHSAAPGNGMYTDFTETVPPVELILGQEYTLSVTHAFTSTTTKAVYKRAYIDYNRNGEFEASELVMNTGSVAAGEPNATSTQTVYVPTLTGAEVGLTRMRVICATVNVTDPCSYYNNSATAEGETEDYAVLLSTPMQVDLGVSSIVHPVGDVCADANANLRVLVRNYGTDPQTLSLANTLTVTATITGAVPGVYTTTVESGTIASSTEMPVKISNVDLSALGDYHVSVEIFYDGDQYQTNNTRSGDAVVSDLTVSQLPYVEPFVPVGMDEISLPADWTVTSSNLNNYVWIEKTGASTNNGTNPSGGPAHDHTSAGTSLEQFGGYATVSGVNGTGNQNKWTSLTSGCINMHYHNIYPAELNFYKYFTGAANADFEMTVEAGSGEFYQTVDQLTKADGAGAQWANHLTVLHAIDEVARLRFTVTHQVNRIDPSIDDINLETGLPDMAVNRVVYPEDKTVASECLQVNTVVVPVIELQNAGNSAVDEFDVVFNVGVGSDVVTETEHIVHHLEPGDTLMYTSTHEFAVTNITQNWEVKATVVIDEDKRASNNTRRNIACTNVGIDDYESAESVYLGQNEPNPAVTVTRIPYSVPEPGKVTMELTNATGQVLYTTTEEADLGTNYIELNTARLAAGVYYYTIHYKDIVLTKKMVVEK